jgi:hypothetical protein
VRRAVLALPIALLACATDDDAQKADGPDVVGDVGDTGPSDIDGDGHTTEDGDCDDADPTVHPGATESCNEQDDDCDGDIDEDVTLPWWPDLDGDGHGAGTPEQACEAPDGTVGLDDDCDDADPAISPSAGEACNGIDDDCDGDVDEDVLVEVYADADADGWGDAAAPDFGCPDDEGTTTTAGDCDDSDPYVHPGIVGDSCDGVDTDCDGDIDEDSKAGWSLLSIDTRDKQVYDIDPASGALSVVTPIVFPELINSMDVSENGLSVVHARTSGTTSTRTIQYLDACTGTLTMIGPHGATAFGGIAFGPDGRLFGIGSGDVLYELDLTTGLATSVGPLGIDIGTSGLAWDCTNQRMFGADGNQDRVFEVDLVTGAATRVRSTGVPFSSVGIEYDRASGLLYAATGTALYTIEPSTGASTRVGDLDASNIDDLAWHPTCP